ncbi:uncharacterized protein LOC129964259 [Argiope bruennichi]|uniref:uncharacterized protein LOC129964259 n=1 Tax=Argiope bruennichi TaxID=94029 RepID=UPI0024952F1D|nr:uncharacterized protein LOC129964259 [Argiope bruennichi]
MTTRLWSSGLESKINDSSVAVQDFSLSHKLNFNPSKSVSSFFITNRLLYNYSPAVYLSDQLLDCDKHPSYLGFTLYPEINYRKHIEKIAGKAREHLRILKYILGRDWGADVSALRFTYCSLMQPILEYGYQIFQMAAASNLKILDGFQLSAARIINGLRNSCPNEVALYEADIVPLATRFKIGSFKYFNKLMTLGDSNRTAAYILNWRGSQRLKRDTPLEYVRKTGVINFEVVPSTTLNCLPPTMLLRDISFNDELTSPANKQVDHPDLLKQLALEVVNSILSGVLVIYTDASKMEDGRTESGVFIHSNDSEVRISIQNTDNCSVFRWRS